MKNLQIPLILLLTVLTLFSCIDDPNTTGIFIVRHADRVENEDALTDLGRIRAGELKRMLKGVGISAIYVSQGFNRTQKTADSLAIELGIITTNYNAFNIPELAASINENHLGKNILVVGHSNTVSQTITELDTPPGFVNIPDDEFDNMYILVLNSEGENTLLETKYGADTPLE